MNKFGISLYPDKATYYQCKDYIDLASKYNFKRIFVNYLGLGKSDEQLVEKFRQVFKYAVSKGCEIVLDVNPDVFSQLNITWQDLKYFKDLNVSTLRLDGNFDGISEAHLSNNSEGIKVELNASLMNKTIDNIVSYQANIANLTACHNFYPQKYSALSYKYFKQYTQIIKNMTIPVSAFVTLQTNDDIGPWDVNDHLPTLEMHRYLPIDFQVRHFFATKLIDYVLISTQFANEDIFKQISEIDLSLLNLKIKVDSSISQIEKEIVFNNKHFVRGDISDYIARSTQTRVKYKDKSIKVRVYDKPMFQIGDIVMPNDNYNKYKGELQIVLQPIENDGKRNYIGSLIEHELLMLEFIQPWVAFKVIS